MVGFCGERVLNEWLLGIVPLCNDTKNLDCLVVDLRKMITIKNLGRYLGVRNRPVFTVFVCRSDFVDPQLSGGWHQQYSMSVIAMAAVGEEKLVLQENGLQCLQCPKRLPKTVSQYQSPECLI